MVLSKNILGTFAAYSAVAAAAPAASQKSSFSLKQVAVPKTAYHHPSVVYAKALAKYGAKIPADLAAAAAAAVNGSVTTTPAAEDVEYVTPVTIGQDVLNIDIDTGSADLWVFTSSLPASERTGHNLYAPGSTATRLSGASWSIQYGDGSSASGVVYKDIVSVGGVSFPSQAVEAATRVSSQFTSDTSIDGLMGLSFSSLNTVSPTSQKTFFDNILPTLSQPVFAADLRHNAPGVYDFGWIDSSKFKGSVTFTNVDDSQGFWMFTASNVAIGGTSQGRSMTGIADTGTTLLLIDNTVVRNYYSKVSGAKNSASQGGWIFPCTATLPSFSLTIGSYQATVPGSLINFAPVDSTGTTCFGGIQSDAGIGFAIFGDIFLKSQYVVFDNSGPTIGFAAQA